MSKHIDISHQKKRFSGALIAHLGQEKAVKFIAFIKTLGLDLSVDEIFIKAASDTERLSSLMSLAETNMPEHIMYTIKQYDKYQCTNEDMTLTRDAILSLCGEKDLANGFVSDLRKLGLDIVQEGKRNFAIDHPTVVRLLFVFWGLGALTKAINLAEAIKQK